MRIILEAGNMLPAKTRTSFILGLLCALAILGFAVSQTTFSHSFCLPVPVSWTCRSVDDPYWRSSIHPRNSGRAIGLFNVGSLGCPRSAGSRSASAAG